MTQISCDVQLYMALCEPAKIKRDCLRAYQVDGIGRHAFGEDLAPGVTTM